MTQSLAAFSQEDILAGSIPSEKIVVLSETLKPALHAMSETWRATLRSVAKTEHENFFTMYLAVKRLAEGYLPSIGDQTAVYRRTGHTLRQAQEWAARETPALIAALEHRRQILEDMKKYSPDFSETLSKIADRLDRAAPVIDELLISVKTANRATHH